MTTETLALTDFLLARIAATEAEANYVRNVGVSGPQYGSINGALSHVLDDVLALCKAHRAIVEFHKSWPVLVETEPTFESADPSDITSMTYRMSKQIAWQTEQQYRERFGTEPPTAPMMRALAGVYADHEDYRAEWAL